MFTKFKDLDPTTKATVVACAAQVMLIVTTKVLVREFLKPGYNTTLPKK